MGVVVGVLVLLLFTIHGLGLFDRLMQRREAATAVLDAPAGIIGTPGIDEPRATTAAGEIVAAIATALALAEDEESQTRQGSRANAPSGTSPDAWSQAGRRALMNRRGRPSR